MRRWLEDAIPDISEAVDSPRRLRSDLSDARRLLEVMPHMPVLVWGRVTSFWCERDVELELDDPSSGGRLYGIDVKSGARDQPGATSQRRVCGEYD